MHHHHRPLRLLAAACALAGLLPTAAAAAPSATRNPAFWVPNARVLDLAVGPDRVYLGGEFSVVGPLTGPAASLDAASGEHQPGFPLINGGFITAAAPDGSGGWYVGGSFDRVGGLPRLDVAHVLADGSVAPGFAPQVDGTVKALALDGSDLYIGGDFTHVGAETRNHLARVNASTGALDATWDPSVTGGGGQVNALAVSAAGVYVGGNFDHAGGQPRIDLALVSKAGGGAADSTFVCDLGGGGDGVRTLLLANGKLYVGGIFTSVHGTNRANLAAVSPTNGTDQGLDADADASVWALAASGSKLFVGGFFSKLTHGGMDTARSSLAAIDAGSGAVDAGWTTSADEGVVGLGVLGSSLYVGGRFTHIGATPRNYLAKVALSDGALDSTWNPTASDEIEVLSVQGSSVFAGGDFNSVNGLVRHNIAALDLASGAAAAGFDPNVDDQVFALLLSGGKLYLGGDFSTVHGETRHRVAAVDPGSGSLDGAFQPDYDDDVFALAGDGATIYAGGRFENLNGSASPGLGAVKASDGTAVWRGDVVGGEIDTLALAGGRLYAGGFFDHIGATARDSLAALNPATGDVVPSINLPAPGGVSELSVFGSRMYVSGFYNHLGGQPRSGVGAIDTGTNAVLPWSPGLTGSGAATIAASLSGVYPGGVFSELDGVPVEGLGLLSADTAALGSWTPDVGNGTEVETLEVGEGKLFAGGRINDPDEVESGLAVYDFGPPVSTSAPVATLAGATLTCSPGSWDSPVNIVGYAWLRDGAAIGGAAGPALQTGPGDSGHSFACRVTAANEGGSSVATSAAVALSSPVVKDSKKPKVGLSKIKRSGRFIKLTLRCPADEQFCQGTVSANAVTTVALSKKKKTRKVKLGSVRFKVNGGKKKALRIKLSRKAVRVVRKRHRVTLTVKTRDAAGNRATLSKRVRLT